MAVTPERFQARVAV